MGSQSAQYPAAPHHCLHEAPLYNGVIFIRHTSLWLLSPIVKDFVLLLILPVSYDTTASTHSLAKIFDESNA